MMPFFAGLQQFWSAPAAGGNQFPEVFYAFKMDFTHTNCFTGSVQWSLRNKCRLPGKQVLRGALGKLTAMTDGLTDILICQARHFSPKANEIMQPYVLISRHKMEIKFIY